MATSEDLIASDEMVESGATLSEDLNCPLCLKVFRSPRRLPCLHSFCQDCLQSHISNIVFKRSIKQLCCPICGCVACFGEISTEKLVHVFPLNTLMLSILMKSKVKVDLMCNACQAQDLISPADDLCSVCEEVLCIQCSKVHRSSRLSSTHTILKIEDLLRKQETVLRDNVMFHCTEHACYPAELYCKYHATQMCARCFIDNHKDCSEVVELTNNTLNLSDTINQMKQQMKTIKDQFKKLTNINVSNLSKLESEVNGLIIEIRTLKKTINDALDDLEDRVKEEGNTLFNKEKMRLEQLKDDCQSHLTATRNSNVVVESASKYASQIQIFVLTKRIINQLSTSKRHIEDKYSKNDILKLKLDVNPQLKSIIKTLSGGIARLRVKLHDEILIVTDGFKPPLK
ncbi:hypothetical protein CHS0354_036241 [Potamilus streckersoni]|uniref:Uncharacterized protein n=1 Tax=Potamilus streckersoni TaxID=2493646 RepID=A0AAE0SVF0_9BIVA|nr:hypothetical protein CHS0354_036241 [Potamilus streckersoni]